MGVALLLPSATAASWRRVPLRGLDAATASLLLLLRNADSTASPNQSVPGTPKRVDPPGHRSALGSRSVADAESPGTSRGSTAPQLYLNSGMLFSESLVAPLNTT